MHEPGTTTSRREFFELVWSKPAADLALELGMAEDDLRRLCSKHHIPCPSIAYWARVARGLSFERPPLRRIDDPARETVSLAGPINSRIAPRQPQIDAGQVPQPQPEAPRLAAEAAREAGDAVAHGATRRQRADQHPAVAATAKALLKAKADASGAVSAIGPRLCGVVVHRDNVERASSILSALALALEAKGLELVADERTMKAAVGKDTATFTLTEKSKRQKHLPTPAEQQAHDRRERRREQAAARGDWALYRSLPYERPSPEFDTVFSGHLVLTISGWNQGLRRNWADGKTQRMESMLDSIVGGIMAVLEISRQRREEAEQRERERAELARRRDLMKRRREREEARIAHLRDLFQLQREATEIRSWLGFCRTLKVTAGRNWGG